MKKKAAVSVVCMLIINVVMSTLLHLYYKNLYTVGWMVAIQLVVSGLVIIYMYHLLGERNTDSRTVIKEKIKIYMVMSVVVAAALTFYVQTLIALPRQAFSSVIQIEHFTIKRMILTLVACVTSVVTMVITHMVMIKGIRVPVVETVADERLINDNLSRRLVKKDPNVITAEMVVASYLRYLFAIIALVLLFVAIGGEEFNPEGTVLNYLYSGQWEKGLNVFSVTACLIIVCIGTTIASIVRSVLRTMAKTMGARGETIFKMLSSLFKYLIALIIIYYCLSMLGVDTQTLLASAGIFSLVIGLGAKELISDILAGLFIIMEGEFQLGDIVMIDGFRGTVSEIGVRTTKLESDGKDVKIINNSRIVDVINMTRQYSYASADIGIDYGESIERVEAVLEKEFPGIRSRLTGIIEGPYYKGIVELGDSSVTIRVLVTCKEEDRIQMQRDLMRELKLAFDRNGIGIPFPQIVVNEPVSYGKATPTEIAASKRFHSTQDDNVMDESIDEE